jgi:hypothetical protein
MSCFHFFRVASMRSFVKAGERPIGLVNVVHFLEMLHRSAGNSLHGYSHSHLIA